MAVRTKNEKLLLTVLATLLFATGNFYGYRWLVKKQSALDLTWSQLQADKGDATLELQTQDMWSRRQGWINQHEPVLGEEGAARAQVLEVVLQGARDNKLDVLEQSINDVQHSTAGTQVNVSVKVKGSMEGLCKWLAALQRPEDFYAVSFFSLKADEDQKSMVATLRISRYFKGGS